MKLIPLIAPLILTGGLSPHSQAAEKRGDTREDLIRLEREWSDAIVKRDTAVMARILADDYVLTTPRGQRATKVQILENFRSPRNVSFEVRGVDHSDMAVRVYGEAAVVTFRFTLKSRTGDRDVETPFRHTDVFVKQEGRWRCVARQATRSAEPSELAGEGAP